MPETFLVTQPGHPPQRKEKAVEERTSSTAFFFKESYNFMDVIY
jgi:hypothetical protein